MAFFFGLKGKLGKGNKMRVYCSKLNPLILASQGNRREMRVGYQRGHT